MNLLEPPTDEMRMKWEDSVKDIPLDVLLRIRRTSLVQAKTILTQLAQLSADDDNDGQLFEVSAHMISAAMTSTFVHGFMTGKGKGTFSRENHPQA